MVHSGDQYDESGTTRVAFARLIVFEWHGVADADKALRFRELVGRRISYPEESRRVRWTWVVTGCLSDSDSRVGPVIFATLNKVRDQMIPEVFDERTWSMKQASPLRQTGEAKSRFFFFPKYNALAFEVNSHVSVERFTERLKGILMFESGLTGPNINPMTEKDGFLERVRSLSAVEEVAIRNVQMSNPEDDEDFVAGEDLLGEFRAQTANLSLKSSDGLNVGRGTILAGLLALAARGYGKATVQGKRTGVPGDAVISTERSIVEKAVFVRSTEDMLERVKELLQVVVHEDHPATGRRRRKKRNRSG